MAFANKIRFRDSDEDRRISTEWEQTIQELSGASYPQTASDWTGVFLKANEGGAQIDINAALSEFGFEGYEGFGSLPPGMISARPPEFPTFSQRLLSGLINYAARRAKRRSTAPQATLRVLPHPKSQAILEELSRQNAPMLQVDLAAANSVDLSEKTVRTRLKELVDLGLVARGPINGWVITEAGRAYLPADSP